jgi:glycosyltransferase involved in cell wall biosynthesis
MDSPILSVVVPTYRGVATLKPLVERLRTILESLTEGAWQIVLVNDGSPDNTWDVVTELCGADRRIVGVNLMRNFGQHNAIMSGFAHATGQFIVTMDDDLQNPPEAIPALLAEIRRGWDVVYGVIREKKHHAAFRNLGSRMVIGTFRRIFGLDIRITSFRILRRQVVLNMMSCQGSFTFLDGLIAWHTKNIGEVPVEHHARAQGQSGYSLGTLITLTLNMLTNFSLLPLQAASLLGFVFSLVGFSMAAFFVVKKLIWDIQVTGFSSIIVAVTLLSGVQLLTVGVMGEYIGRIHINISKRPQYAVRQTLNGCDAGDAGAGRPENTESRAS